jgi:hypothetical protein
MDGNRYRTYDLWAKFLAPVLTAAGMLLSVCQFNRQQAVQLERELHLIDRNNASEFRRRRWEKQRDVYIKLSNVLGRISMEGRPKEELSKDIDEFFALYRGELALVQDPQVRTAAEEFRRGIIYFEKGDDNALVELRQSAERLIIECRDSSERSMDTQFR